MMLVSVFASFCHRYVRQFREIFTEEGRRQVKITHQVPGRAPVVSYTQVCNTAALATTKSTASVSTTQPASYAAHSLVRYVIFAIFVAKIDFIGFSV